MEDHIHKCRLVDMWSFFHDGSCPWRIWIHTIHMHISIYIMYIYIYIRYRYMYISCIHICIYVLSERNTHPLSSHENHCQCHVGTRANMLHRVANGKERNGNHLTCKVCVQKRSIMSWINSYNGRSPLKIKTCERKKERKKERKNSRCIKHWKSEFQIL